MNRIEKEMDKLEVEYKHGRRLYQKKIEWIMFQNIHAFTKVRLQVMKFSEVSTLEKVAR